ncbi:hypothetical protein JX265_004976 [Neoarthrinium moseri]|uniref:EamA domain-containing protein n=1 Tax=Neoarthrinium moseri TaxID=1658444 RepID=A0A9Q0ARZ6_9PEZI|nr:hypothetical protein JX265_004976 [Neoarthrinium moseri]
MSDLDASQAPQPKRSRSVSEHAVLNTYPQVLDSTDKGAKAGSAEPGLLDPSTIRRFSMSPFSEDGRLASSTSLRGSYLAPPRSSALRESFSVKPFCQSMWQRNGGPILIILAQFFGALMNLSARFLEVEDGLHPMQILGARMTATIMCCFAYMWFRDVPSAPWGPPEIRWLLMLRAMAGFVGLYGMWSSIVYLPLAEATVISFLAPNVAGYLCRILLKEPFTRKEQIASYIALGGVILITRPVSLFTSAPDAPSTGIETAANGTASTTAGTGMDYVPTTAQRLSGIGMGLLGVVGAAITITVLRTIGPRAHPLISVNYFSTFCSGVSLLAMALGPPLDYDQPRLRFALPASPRQCLLLAAVGVCGFATQFLLTAGLARERSNRATGMIYTAVLFAAAFDRLVFGQSMGWLSVAGCGLVVGSALWVALVKGTPAEEEARKSGGAAGVADLEARGAAGVVGNAGGEDIPMLADVDGSTDGESQGEDVLEMDGIDSWRD